WNCSANCTPTAPPSASQRTIRDGSRARSATSICSTASSRLNRSRSEPVTDSRLVDRLRASERILVFCGAGVSTASGIPDFRGPGGVWTRRRPVEYHAFLASETARVEYWDYKLESWEIYQRAQPNAVHHAIVALERAGKVAAVVTQ